MKWRLRSTDFKRMDRSERARGLMSLVAGGTPVGILAYSNAVPVGWCSIAPRISYRGLRKSTERGQVDDARVWSVVCFFVDIRWRRKGISLRLLRAAVEYARMAGAKIVEGYPADPGARHQLQMGSLSTFRKAGFRDVTPPGSRNAARSGRRQRTVQNVIG
jgi:GNAT superfamily N-acetyltransferase